MITYQPTESFFSEIQKRKIHHLFNVLDSDGNGLLQPDDFVNVGRKIVSISSLSKDSRSGHVILLKSHRLFVQMLSDLNSPELSLTLWDWVAFFRDQIESDSSCILDHYIQRTSRHIFDLFDLNRDKLISTTEYASMLQVYQVHQDIAQKSFDELDTNEDGFISSDEMVAGLNNFFRSSDPDAKGNLIFGSWR